MVRNGSFLFEGNVSPNSRAAESSILIFLLSNSVSTVLLYAPG